MNALTESEIIVRAAELDARYQDMANADTVRELLRVNLQVAEKNHARAKDAYLVARARLVKKCVIPALHPLSAKATALAARPQICAENHRPE